MRSLVVTWVVWLLGPGLAAAQPTVRLGWSRTSPGAVEAQVPGLDRLPSSDHWSDERWRAILPVCVAGSNTALPGHYTWVGERLRFTPAYPFAEGISYRVQLRGQQLRPGLPDTAVQLTVQRKKRPATAVLRVYPSTDRIPENLLRFYVYFSAPMREGVALAHVHLYNEQGRDLRDVFFDGQYELWNADHTRLTLLVDPGRVKTGLVANQQRGRAFAAGHRYRLIVDAAWPDLHGRALGQGFTKAFQGAPAVERAPTLASWQLRPPIASTRLSLQIRADTPLDHVSAYQFVHIVTGTGQVVPGELHLRGGEREVVFEPARPWARGRYYLLVNARLEDIVGNNLNGLFDHPVGGLQQTQEGFTARRAFSIP